jgi:hypothetical protein
MPEQQPPEHVPPETMSGTLLTNPAWLADRVRDTGRRWGCANPRINGTLWWYSASSTLVADPILALLANGRAPTPQTEHLQIALRENGYLASTHTSVTLTGPKPYATALINTCADIITPLAAVSGAAPRALWAIATDSIANRALDAGRTLKQVQNACVLAATLCTPPLVTPRFTTAPRPSNFTADVAEPTMPIVRRSPCFLIYQTTSGNKCTSCPRQPRQPTRGQAPLLRVEPRRSTNATQGPGRRVLPLPQSCAPPSWVSTQIGWAR